MEKALRTGLRAAESRCASNPTWRVDERGDTHTSRLHTHSDTHDGYIHSGCKSLAKAFCIEALHRTRQFTGQ